MKRTSAHQRQEQHPPGCGCLQRAAPAAAQPPVLGSAAGRELCGRIAAIWLCHGMGRGMSRVRVCGQAQAGHGQEQGVPVSKLGAGAVGAAEPQHSSVPAGAKPESSHREHLWDSHLQSPALGCPQGWVVHCVLLSSELSTAQGNDLFISCLAARRLVHGLESSDSWGPEAFQQLPWDMLLYDTRSSPLKGLLA